MIRHIVLFTVREGEDVDAIVSELHALSTIPFSTCFEVRPNRKVDPIPEAADIVVYGEFADLDALARFKAHPTYKAVTERVRGKRDIRFSADIES